MDKLILIICLGFAVLSIGVLVCTFVWNLAKAVLDWGGYDTSFITTWGYDKDTDSIVAFREIIVKDKIGYIKLTENNLIGLSLIGTKHCIKNILPELSGESRHYQLTDKYVIAFKRNGYVYVEYGIHNGCRGNHLTIMTRRKIFGGRLLARFVFKFK